MRLVLCALLVLAVGCADSGDAPPPATPSAPAAPSANAGLPETLGGMARRSMSTDTDAALGESITETIALYGAPNSTGEPSLEVYVTDFGDEEMAEMMGLGWGLRDEASSVTEVQSSEQFDGHPARRTWDSAAQKGRLQVLADGTHFVEVRAEEVPESLLDDAARAGLATR